MLLHGLVRTDEFLRGMTVLMYSLCISCSSPDKEDKSLSFEGFLPILLGDMPRGRSHLRGRFVLAHKRRWNGNSDKAGLSDEGPPL